MPQVLGEGLWRAQQAWPGSFLCAVSAHGMRPDGSTAQDGLWCLLFRDGEKVRALVRVQGAWTAQEEPPVVGEAVPRKPIAPTEIVHSRELAERLCGLRGFDAWQGRPEDALWIGTREDHIVAVLSSAGTATLTVNARDPSQVLSMDFEPVQGAGDPV